MRLLAFLEYSAIFVGGLAIIAGQIYVIPKGVYLGIFVIGAGIALGGLESIFTRQLSFFSSDTGEAYGGAPAVLWGLMTLLAGAVVIGSAYLAADGSLRIVTSHLMRRPGPALAALGFLFSGAGILLMLNPRGRRGVWWTLLVRVPKTAIGLTLLIAGLAGIGLGFWEWLDPRAFERFSRNAWNWFDLRALERLWRNVFIRR